MNFNNLIMTHADLEKFTAITLRIQELKHSNYTWTELATQLAWLEINTCTGELQATHITEDAPDASLQAHQIIQRLTADTRNQRRQRMLNYIRQHANC